MYKRQRQEFLDQYIAEAGIKGQEMPRVVREKLDSIKDNLESVSYTHLLREGREGATFVSKVFNSPVPSLS